MYYIYIDIYIYCSKRERERKSEKNKRTSNKEGISSHIIDLTCSELVKSFDNVMKIYIRSIFCIFYWDHAS